MSASLKMMSRFMSMLAVGATIGTLAVAADAHAASDGYGACTDKAINEACSFVDIESNSFSGYCCPENGGRNYCFEDACPEEVPNDGSSQDGGSSDGSSQDGTAQDGSSQDGTAQDGSSQDGSSQDGPTPVGSSNTTGSADGDDDDSASTAGTDGDTDGDGDSSSGCSADDSGSPRAAATSVFGLMLGAALFWVKRRRA